MRSEYNKFLQTVTAISEAVDAKDRYTSGRPEDIINKQEKFTDSRFHVK